MASDENAKRISEALKKPRFKSIILEGLDNSATALLFASLFGNPKNKNRFLFILDDEEEAGYFYNDLIQVIGDQKILFFPSSYRRAIKYNQKDAANEILRTDTLTKINQDDAIFIISYPDAVAEKVLSKKQLDDNTLTILKDQRFDFSHLELWLEQHGFVKVDYVYEPGQFAIRGSIVDIYSFASEIPFRIDFFGDDVDSIRSFDVQTQLSEQVFDSVQVVPELSESQDGYISILDFLSEDYMIVTKDVDFVCAKVEQIVREGVAKQADIEDKALNKYDDDDTKWADSNFKKLVVNSKEFKEQINSRKQVVFSSVQRSERLTEEKHSTTIQLHTSPQPLFHKNFTLFRNECARLLNDDYRIVIMADNEKQIIRLKELLVSDEIQGEIIKSENIHFVEATIHHGFIFHDNKTAIFTDHQIFERYHKFSLKNEKARKGKMALTLKEIQQFQIGDYVVHIDHGVGQFAGLIRVPLDGVMQEMIKIVYQNDDFVYVSIHSLHKVSKYKGKEGEPPRVNRLGTGAWERMKERVKSKVKDIARDLIKLYANRMKEKGFAFSADSYMQHELEASFIYEDTPDQLKATADVKQDMESERPMDRLICGDVGFGKTEIAVRAACKAAADGKQTAVLVPTTVLAYQHFRTFSQRLANFPVTVDYLTRARTPKEVKELLHNLKSGKIDIIIGTHKLIGKDVQFKDLGLLVIDEEQKFGVGVKEKLRQMKVNVDTLTMTATPIPRTLQFSLMGARDLSVLNTPPPNRYPIQTEIHTLSPQIVAEAVNFELSRNGQVFFVNNKISNLPELKRMIERNVPDARVCVGHGRMEPKDLEKMVLDFMNYEYDVMLSTTIIENGIDVPNANTIIINSAHNYGLSDLHQMRGRVGRGNKKAFCYLLAPPLAALPDHARRRLRAIESFSELGSGINIAMQDLDIRGAGNLLGAEQSGFIADLGYETYQKVLNEAVNELRAEEFAGLWAKQNEENALKAAEKKQFEFDIDFVNECNIETDIPAYFSETYIPSSSERMSLYRELDAVKDEEELAKYKERLIDRFGSVTPEGEELLRIMPLKKIACKLGMGRIYLKKKTLVAYLVENLDSPYYASRPFGNLLHYMTQHPRQCKLIDGKKRAVRIDNVPTIADALNILRDIYTTDNN